MTFSGVKIYTAWSSKTWRVLKSGERYDRRFSFDDSKTDPKDSWQELASYVMKLARA
jgi:hypothetical protein